jgi:type VI protein secretion system component Hcp
MRSLALALSALLVSAAALADHSPPASEHNAHVQRSFISVTINGLACTSSAGAAAFDARTWSWGASNTGTGGSGGGGSTGRPVTNALTITKAFDSCSPSLFGAVTKGRRFQTLTLTDRDEDGVVVATLNLTDVQVSSWTVGSSIHDEAPDETVIVGFRKVCLAGGGSAQICFDTLTGVTS